MVYYYIVCRVPHDTATFNYHYPNHSFRLSCCRLVACKMKCTLYMALFHFIAQPPSLETVSFSVCHGCWRWFPFIPSVYATPINFIHFMHPKTFTSGMSTMGISLTVWGHRSVVLLSFSCFSLLYATAIYLECFCVCVYFGVEWCKNVTIPILGLYSLPFHVHENVWNFYKYASIIWFELHEECVGVRAMYMQNTW